MSARVGYIMRNEDVHGVSGEGKVAEIFEASNGKCVVIWLSENPSVNTYDHVKAVQNTHGHGGKTQIVWVWEDEPDADPMDAVFEKKVEEAKAAIAGAHIENPVVVPEGSTGSPEDLEKIASKVVEMLVQKSEEKEKEKE